MTHQEKRLAALAALTTAEELKECRPQPKLKLEYLKGSKETNKWMADYGVVDGRMWNIIQPGNVYHGSTRTIDGLKELGII